MTEKEKREGVAPSPERDGKRDETDSLTTNSITRDPEKVKQICENLREYAKACRYALSQGERYAALPMREDDAADFETAAALLEALASDEISLQDEKKPKPKKGEPVGEFRIYAQKSGCALLYEALGAFEEMRNRKKKPLTEYARRRAISKLRAISSDPNVQAEIVLQSVDHCWEGFFALKSSRQTVPAQSSDSGSFDTKEFFEAAVARTLQMHTETN